MLIAQNINAKRTGQFNSQLATASSQLNTSNSLFSLGTQMVGGAQQFSNNIQSIGGLFGVK
jgi:hypothetical protein